MRSDFNSNKAAKTDKLLHLNVTKSARTVSLHAEFIFQSDARKLHRSGQVAAPLSFWRGFRANICSTSACSLLFLTQLLHEDTHTHTHTYTRTRARSRAAGCSYMRQTPSHILDFMCQSVCVSAWMKNCTENIFKLLFKYVKRWFLLLECVKKNKLSNFP